MNVEKNTLESFHTVAPSLPVQKNAKDGMLRIVQSSKNIIRHLTVLKYREIPNPSSSASSDFEQILQQQNHPVLTQNGNFTYSYWTDSFGVFFYLDPSLYYFS